VTPFADKYWSVITNPRVLRMAAHLVDKDSWSEFHDLHVDRQVFSYARDSIIQEICASLQAERYMPEPCISVTIPKSPHSQRPGAILPYRDKVVIQAIIMCLAPKLDLCLSKSVWSWRVKRDLRGRSADQLSKRGIFRETDITAFPFLKRKTVIRHVEPFDPWYALWPRFDRVSRKVLAEDRYHFMVVSDIAGYFENIQLSLLHSLLNRYEPDAPYTINLLMRHLSSWCGIAHDGSKIDRGIPQGNSASSFLGNFFLKPVDDFFMDQESALGIRYFRYVDDIRIVAETENAARAAALALEEQIRRLKLNLQSAKTAVLTSDEALKLITDRRLDDLEACRRAVKRDKGSAKTMRQLAHVANDPGDCKGHIKIKHSRPPLSGLNLRVFRIWSGLHLALGSATPAMRMCREAVANPDYRVTRDVRKLAYRFPRSTAIPNQLWKAILNSELHFPYQEAELIRALRGFSHIPEGAFDHVATLAQSCEADPYLRLQAILFLCRFPGVRADAENVTEACLSSPDARVIIGSVLAAGLGERRAVAEHVRTISRHASPYAHRLIQFIRALRVDRRTRRNLLAHVFEEGGTVEGRLYEHAPYLRFMATGPHDAAYDLIGHIRSTLRAAKLSRSAKELLQFLALSCARSLNSDSRRITLVAEAG
jgi:hypothetical protein